LDTTPSSALGFTIRYGQSAAITRKVTGNGFYTPVLQPGQQYRLAVEVTIPRTVAPGNGIQAELGVVSNSDFDTDDAVRFIAIRR